MQTNITSKPGDNAEPLTPMNEITPDPDLVEAVQRKRLLTPLTKVLLGLVAAASIFLVGVRVERSNSSGSASSLPAGVPPNIASLFGGNVPGAGGAGSVTGDGSTRGTVKLVDGNNVYVSDAQGNVIKVKTDSSTDVKVNENGVVGDLKPGKSVVVQGTTQQDGAIVASSVAETQGGGGLTGFPGGAPATQTSAALPGR